MYNKNLHIGLGAGLIALLLLTLVTPTPVHAIQASDVGIVSGIVLFNGQPLADVEVFLGIFSGPFEARYTCTDANGNFMFTGVPLDTNLWSATGIEVFQEEPCGNPYFFDFGTPQRGSPHRGHPLLIQYWDHHNGIREFDGFSLTSENPTVFLQYDVLPWPTYRFPELTNLLKRSIIEFHNGNSEGATRLMVLFIRQVESREQRGFMSREDADLLIAYAENLIVYLFNL